LGQITQRRFEVKGLGGRLAESPTGSFTPRISRLPDASQSTVIQRAV